MEWKHFLRQDGYHLIGHKLVFTYFYEMKSAKMNPSVCRREKSKPCNFCERGKHVGHKRAYNISISFVCPVLFPLFSLSSGFEFCLWRMRWGDSVMQVCKCIVIIIVSVIFISDPKWRRKTGGSYRSAILY